jgi:hypothetical protein
MKSMDLKHETFISTDKTNGIYHVQNVNNQVSGFRRWITGNFNSVSTKYLQNYLYFYEMKEVIKKNENKTEEFLKFSLVDEKSFGRNREIEKVYQETIVSSYKEDKEDVVKKVRNDFKVRLSKKEREKRRVDYLKDLLGPNND